MAFPKSLRRFSAGRSLRRQAGYLMVEASLALAIAAFAAYGGLKSFIETNRMQFATIQGEQLKRLRDGLETYVSENFSALQFGQPVTKTVGGVTTTLANGTAAGQSYSPTIAQLIAMGYLTTGFSTQGSFDNGQTPGNYQVQVQTSPAGCVANSCDVIGYVWLDQPVRAAGSTEPDGPAVTAISLAVGEHGGYSMLPAPGNIVGVGGNWNWPNPVAGTPAGVVAARFGFVSSGLGIFVRLNDFRDPNLQGNLTTVGQITGSGDIGTRQETSADPVGAADCLRAVLKNDGQILSRAAGCINRGYINPQTGQIGVNNAAGTTAVAYMDGNTGRMTAERLLSTTFAAPGAACTQEGDIVQDNTSTSAGMLVCRSGHYVVIGGAALGAIENGACTDEGAIARNTALGEDGLLVCRSGQYKAAGGLPVKTAGSACTNPGQLAQTSAKVTLICRSGTFVSLSDRLPYVVFVDSVAVADGYSVGKPACGSGGTPMIYVMPQSFDAVGYVNFYATNGGTWTVRITDGLGASIAGSGLAQTYCYYPT